MSGYYFIVSQMNGMALDVEGNNPLPGTKVAPFPKHGGSTQQWRFDSVTGTIRNKLNDFCMDIENDHLVLNPYQHGKQNQQWEREGKLIANRNHKHMVLDISGGYLVLNPYQSCKGDQQWERRCNVIANRSECDKVLAIAGCQIKVVKIPTGCGSNQSWTFEDVPC